MNIIVTFFSPCHEGYWKAVEHIPCLFIYLSLVSVQYFFVVGIVCSFFCTLLSFFQFITLKAKIIVITISIKVKYCILK